MERNTLRRIGWVGASLGLTTALVGCTDAQSGAESASSASAAPSVSVGYLSSDNGLNSLNGMNAANGLNSLNGLNATNGLTTSNGMGSVNGFNSTNGFNGTNGFNSLNGFNSNNGLNSTNGMNLANGLNSLNGLAAGAGYMTTDAGRQTISYLVKCALAAGDTLVKQDQSGNNFTFKGGIGLAPQWKTGSCNQACSEALSSCMMAHINTSGVHIPLWMTSPMSQIGWGQSPSFPTQEGTFFGQIFLVNPSYNLDAYYCNGPSVASDVVPGRLGSSQGNVPYANAYPTSGGLCNAAGHCTMQANGDGAVSCVGNGITWNSPITVWRGKTFQAEDATLTGAASVITDSHNSNGRRVGNLNSSSSVKFSNVPAATAGVNNLVVYYANGDSNGLRYFNVKVNGGAAQSKGFKYLNGWGNVGQATITLTGFNVGNNTVEFVGDGSNNVPDLDWIEVIGASANFCDHSRWTVTSSNAGSSDPALNAIDDYDQSRWTSGRNQDGTDWFQVDFGGLVTMSNMTLTNVTYDQNDYPKEVQLFGSTDGVTFSSSYFAKAAGTSGATVITFPTQTLRAVKLKQTGGSRSSYWSINEFDTDCAVAANQASTTVNYCDYKNWTATATNGAAGNAIDGDLSSRFTTGRAQDGTDAITVNFGGTVKITGVTLNNSSTSSGDYPGGYAIYGSSDGMTFGTTAIATGSGAATQTVATFAQQTVRAIKIVQTGTANSSHWWSIGEVQVAGCAM